MFLPLRSKHLGGLQPAGQASREPAEIVRGPAQNPNQMERPG